MPCNDDSNTIPPPALFNVSEIVRSQFLDLMGAVVEDLHDGDTYSAHFDDAETLKVGTYYTESEYVKEPSLFGTKLVILHKLWKDSFDEGGFDIYRFDLKHAGMHVTLLPCVGPVVKDGNLTLTDVSLLLIYGERRVYFFSFTDNTGHYHRFDNYVVQGAVATVAHYNFDLSQCGVYPVTRARRDFGLLRDNLGTRPPYNP